MTEKAATKEKKLNIDKNRLYKVRLGGITFKKIETHLKRCESCGHGRFHVWVVQMGVKTIGTITFCPKCRVHESWGKEMYKKDEMGMIPAFQEWLDKNL